MSGGQTPIGRLDLRGRLLALQTGQRARRALTFCEWMDRYCYCCCARRVGPLLLHSSPLRPLTCLLVCSVSTARQPTSGDTIVCRFDSPAVISHHRLPVSRSLLAPTFFTFVFRSSIARHPSFFESSPAFAMTGPALSSITEQADGLLGHTFSTAVHLVSASTSAVLGVLPAPISHIVNSIIDSAQQLLTERWEARVAALCLMVPSLAVLAVVLSTAIAVLWPFTFLVGTIGGLSLAAAFLFWPSSSDLKTCLVSAAFALAAQLLLVLPVYFLSPLALFVLLLAASAYFFLSRSYILLLCSAWWLITTPYWSVIHFVTFPFLFTASILAQVASTVAALVAITLYPELPALIQRHYQAFREQRRMQTKGNTYHAAAGSEHVGSNGSGNGEWTKTEYGTTKRREGQVKEESKSHE